MRRTIFMALFAALLLAPTAHAAGPTDDLLRDCADDGVLQGDYSPKELRKAQTQLPTDIDEYSDCRDVLSRAISANASKSNNNSGGTNPDASTANSGGTDSAPAATPTPAPLAGTTTSTGKDPGVVVEPATKEDWDTIGRASAYGGNAVELNGQKVSPGATRLAASVGRNGLPVNLLVVMILLGAVTLVALLPLIRRRVVARPSA